MGKEINKKEYDLTKRIAIAFIDYANVKAWLRNKGLGINLQTLYEVFDLIGIRETRFYYGSDFGNNNINNFLRS